MRSPFAVAHAWPTAARLVIASMALLGFAFARNEFLFANFLSNANTRTQTAATTELVTPVGTEWTHIMAADLIVVLLAWLAALAAKKYLVGV